MDTPASTYYNPSGAGFSSDRMDWRTPPDLFRALDDEFHFTLDAAANEANHLCDRYYTATDSAFSHSWAGERVFCNPPYGRDAAKWIEKCAREGGGLSLPHSFRRAPTRAHSTASSTSSRTWRFAFYPAACTSDIPKLASQVKPPHSRP